MSLSSNVIALASGLDQSGSNTLLRTAFMPPRTVESLLLAGYFLEIFQRLDKSIVVGAELDNIVYGGVGPTLAAAMVDLNFVMTASGK